jgi:mannose-6-phosphate isomerase-like protein (cupin superfamily)
VVFSGHEAIMIRRAFCVALVGLASGAIAGQQLRPNLAGPDFVSASELKQAIADARPWPPDPTVKYKRFGSRDGYSYWVVQRDGTGEVEQHDDWNDIFVVQSGEATLLTGGQITGGKQTSPGETLGGEIAGGRRQPLAANDMHIVPAGTPHQFLVEPGRAILYVTLKTARQQMK